MEFDPDRHPLDVARDLLGCTVVCRGTAAVITEVEAYHQLEEACHAYGGRPTPRTRDLFGPAGTWYVYFTYGMHWCANVVTGREGSGEAVLLRAGEPLAGEQLMRERRAAPRAVDPAAIARRDLCAGPARLTQALDIRSDDSGSLCVAAGTTDVTEALERSHDGPLLVRDAAAAAQVGIALPLDDRAGDVLHGPRIGISRAVELPWRLGVRGAAHSKPFR